MKRPQFNPDRTLMWQSQIKVYQHIKKKLESNQSIQVFLSEITLRYKGILSTAGCQVGFPSIRDTIFGDEMHSSSLELGRKRVELNVCESFKYFPQKLLRKYLKKKYLFFQKSNFTMKGASVKVAILSFFSQLAMKPLHKKNQL